MLATLDQTRVFWQLDCTNRRRIKEKLVMRAVDFESIML